MSHRPLRAMIPLVLSLIGLHATAARTQAPPLPTLLQSRLQALVQQGIPGITLAVVQSDGRVIRLAAGAADVEKGIAMTPDRRMLSGSIGKTLVAALVLQLVQEKQIDPQAPLRQYFPAAPWLDHLPNGRQVTVDMLLSHTSGIPEHVEVPELWVQVKKAPDRVWRPEELLAFIADAKPLFPAGGGWAYADTNYILLGMLVEKVTGRRYNDEVVRRLVRPQGLDGTAPAVSRDMPGLASGYSGMGQPFDFPAKVAENERYCFNPQVEWTGGGFVTRSADLARWAHRLYGGKVLAPASLARMLTPAPFPTDLPGGARYGRGVILWQTPLGAAWGHSGFAPGYNSIMEYYPDLGLAVAMQVNTDTAARKLGRPLHEIVVELAQLIRDHGRVHRP